MRCWINGSECWMQSGNDYGLLDIVETFCLGCFILHDNREVIKEVMKFPQEKRLLSTEFVNEDDLFCLANNVTLIVAALRLLERKYKEKISKIEKGRQKDTEISWKIEENLQDISELKEVFKKLKTWYTT